ncbi:MAG: DUF58 domain-containing protein [Oscillospiraceae bacterium]|nr:DUF58 domain-containing protein [Oscillospiraceae bacterium]
MTAVIWMIWCLSLVALAVCGQTSLLIWMMAAIPFCIIFSAAATWYASRKISLSVVIKESGTKHKGASGEMRINNRSFLPVVQLRCAMHIDNLLTGESYEQPLTFSVCPKDNRKMAIAIEARRCGHLRITFTRARALDYFGLLRFPIKFSASYDTIVMPDSYEILVIPAAQSYSPEDSEEYVPNRAGNDVSETHQIRQYLPGDSIRQIHWKLTGKYDQLMVRECAMPLKYSMVLFFDTSYPEGKKPSPACLDALAETAVALSEGLLEAGIAHMMAWRQSDGSLERRPITDSDTLSDLLPELLAGQEHKTSMTEQRSADLFDKMSFSQLIWLCACDATPYFETEAQVTAICSVPSKKKNDSESSEAVIYISPKSYKQDLESIII